MDETIAHTPVTTLATMRRCPARHRIAAAAQFAAQAEAGGALAAGLGVRSRSAVFQKRGAGGGHRVVLPGTT
jgi:hypothetical protein